MKKRLFALFILGLFLVLGFVGTAFPQNLTDIEAERLIKEERVLQKQNLEHRGVSEPDSFYQGLLESMITELRRGGRDIGSFDDPWMSKNPGDLKPLMGTKWEFTYTILSEWIDTITFGETTITDDDGNIILLCNNEYGTLGGAAYTEMPGLGRGYLALIPGAIIDENYFFQISGNNASGFYMSKSHSTGEYSDLYPLTGVKISEPQEQTSTIDFPDGDVAPLGNPDGIVNIGDAVLCLRFALGLEPGHPTAVELIHGDVAPLGQDGFPNPDGKIDVADALVILRKALGLVDWTKPLLSEWKASTDFGDLKFTVNADGTAVTEVSYIFSSWTCGSSTRSGTIKVTNPSGWPITNRQFTIENDLNPDPLLSEMMTISGTFDQSGTHASGTWQADLDDAVCSGTWQAATISDSITFDYAYLQYRSHANSYYDRYIGWVMFTKEGNPIDESDIEQVILKDSSGNEVSISSISFWQNLSVYRGKWNSGTSNVDYYAEPYAGYSIGFPSNNNLPKGNYTYEATTSNEIVLKKSVYFPGLTTMPCVNAATMYYEWKNDGSLYVSWDNPAGSYDQISIVLANSDTGIETLSVSLPNNIEELTIPSNVVENLTSITNTDYVDWSIQTRSYGSDNNQYARGNSGIISFLWNPQNNGQTGITGQWKASTDFGDLKFTVNSDGTAVTEVSYVFSSWTCGSATRSGTIKVTNASGWPITNRQFTIENDLHPDPLLSEMMTVSGTFDQSGTHASGTWQADLGDAVCSGSWQASPI